MAKRGQVDVGGRADEHDREVAQLVGEHVHLVAVEDPHPRHRRGHRPIAGSRAPAVGAGHIRHPRVAPEVGHAPRREQREAAASVDDEIGLDCDSVDDDAHHVAVSLDEAVHAPDLEREPANVGGRSAQRTLVGRAARADTDDPAGDAGEGPVDLNRAEREPRAPRLGPLGEEQISDLRAEAVRVFELHHASPAPRAVASRSGIAVDGDGAVAAPGEGGAQRQAGGAGADDDHVHGGRLHFCCTERCLITL